MMPSLKAKGFTLVELAIALVIIALLVGGMFIGGSFLMDAAKTSSLLSQIKDLATASREFKNRYGYFPGDLPNAATLITGVSAGCSYPVGGNVGNGIVDTATESTCALEHLVKAGLLSKVELSGTTYTIPHAFGGGYASLSFNPTSNENVVRVSSLPCQIALSIDRKLDNASVTPLASGIVTGWDASASPINTCDVGGSTDPIASLLIRY